MPFDWYGDEVEKKTRKAANKAMYQAAENLLTEANKLVPHDEGTLEGSGMVTQEKLPNPKSAYARAKTAGIAANHNTKVDWQGKPEFYISYNTPYAVRWHEADTGTVNFRGGRQSKWLEKTSKRIGKKTEEWVAKEFRKWMR